VLRDRVGEADDRFFAAVFLGSGLMFVATLFAAGETTDAGCAAIRAPDNGLPSLPQWERIGPLTNPERRGRDRSVWAPLTPPGLPPEAEGLEPHLGAWSS
jgi:hypothetical protein